MSVTPSVEFRKVSKSFGAVQANKDISFSVASGEIHGIVGENGAGKSTAMKMLFGLYQADEGKILVNGQEAQLTSPLDAMTYKIGMVHQHFMLAEPLTALDNILLQQKGSAFSILPRAEQKKRLDEIAVRYGFQINLNSKVEDLSVGEQQRLEILKVLSQDSQIIILDEPTAVLTPQEVQDLFKNLRLLKDEGRTIIIITHKLKEVLRLTDSVTVFRAGQVTAVRKTSETSIEDLAELMVGRRLHQSTERTTTVDTSKVLLSVKELRTHAGSQFIEGINLQVRAGEIVGIAGVEGNGQDVLIRALTDQSALDEKSLHGEIKSQGIWGSFPEDRLRFGVLAKRPLYENFLLGQQKRFARGPFLKIKELMTATKAALEAYDVRPRNEKAALQNLSGGNQQKLVVARALSQNPDLILAAQPTRGVDIGAIDFIHSEIRKCRDRGAGVLLISSELDELMTLSDRILVLYQGKIAAEFVRGQFDEIALGAAMGGCR